MTNAETTATASETDAHEHGPGTQTTRHRRDDQGSRRPRRRARRLWAIGAALAVAVAATACLPPGSNAPADHGGMLSMINASRSVNHLGALAEDAQLDSMAQNWAQQLAATRSLTHQNLAAIIVSPSMAGWQRLTENLFEGGGSSTNALVENAWMASPGHRANILDPNVNRVGVGVAHDGAGNTYVVADFGLR